MPCSPLVSLREGPTHHSLAYLRTYSYGHFMAGCHRRRHRVGPGGLPSSPRNAAALNRERLVCNRTNRRHLHGGPRDSRSRASARLQLPGQCCGGDDGQSTSPFAPAATAPLGHGPGRQGAPATRRQDRRDRAEGSSAEAIENEAVYASVCAGTGCPGGMGDPAMIQAHRQQYTSSFGSASYLYFQGCSTEYGVLCTCAE